MMAFEPGSILPEMLKEEFLMEIEFTSEQRKDLEDVRAIYRPAIGSAGSEEKRKKKTKEYEEKVLDLLTPEQKAVWEIRKAEIIAKAKEAAAPAKVTGAPGPKQTFPTETPPEGATPVVSFVSENAESNDPSNGPTKLAFNFQYAPWTEVLELFASTADLTLDLKDTPSGTFTYRDSRSYTPTQALDVLNGYLLPRGYLLVRRDRFLVCLSIAGDSIPPNLAPQISVAELAERGKNELVSVVIPVQGLQADQVIAEVRELLGPQGKASALKNTNSIVVTDLASHVRRIHALLMSESVVDTRDTAFKAIPLKHITAGEAERMVRRLFGLNSTTNMGGPAQPPAGFQPGQPGGGGGWGGGGPGGGGGWGGGWGRRRDRGEGGGGGSGGGGDQDPNQQQNQNQQQPNQPPAPPVASGNASQFANKIQVTADARTNQLLVSASAALLRVVEDAVKTLDTDTDGNGNKILRNEVTLTMKTYNVPGGDVATIAETINMLVPGVVLRQDTRTGRLYVQATREEHEEVAGLVQELSGEGSSTVAVVYLKKMDPVPLANTLNNLFLREGARAPTVEADPLGRRLIVRGTPDQLLQVKTILAQLGEGDGAQKDPSERGATRSLSLGGRDPEEFLPLIRDAWSASRSNPIRIRFPSRPQPIRERAVPGASRDNETRDNESKEEPVDNNDKQTKPTLFRRAAFEAANEPADAEPAPQEPVADEPVAQDPVAQEPAAEKAAIPKKGAENSQPVSIQVIGDQIIITSPDTDALDQFEELYNRLSLAMPSRTKWTVFYLRSADATEAAQMVERLFPQSDVSMTTSSSSNSGMLGSLAGGISTLGRGLMNASGLNQTLSNSQHMRIVTDIRSNALYVSGPADQIAEVEQILEVLDASELPQSLRDRVPRTIAVEHADVNEAAEIVEAVFKDAMTPDNPMGGRGGGGFNPLMMLMGGGGAPAPGGRRQPSVQLTVGVDKRTNNLIVSCNDSLFQQIEKLVQGIDERAKQSRQTVRVVKLDQADPTLVQQTLGSIMTKVTVGATRRSRRPAGTPGGPAGGQPMNGNQPNGGGPGGPGGGNDQMRDAMMQRMMMERMNGGGGNGGGGRRGFGGGGNGGGGGGGNGGGGGGRGGAPRPGQP